MRKFLVSSVLAVVLLLAWSLFGLSTRDTLTDNEPPAPTVASAGATESDQPLETDSIEETARASHRASAARDEFVTAPVSQFIPVKSAAPAVRRLIGRVLDVDDRKPVAECRLEFVQEGRSSKVMVTDALGRFETPAIFAAGIVEVRTRSFRMDPDSRVYSRTQPRRIWLDGATDPAQPSEVEIFATPAIRVDVAVRGPDAAPVAGASICTSFELRGDGIDDPEAEARSSYGGIVKCDQDGRGSFWAPRGNRESCALNLQVILGDGVFGRLVTIEPPLPTEPIVLVADVGGAIDVRVVDARGHPVPEVNVELVELESAASSIDRSQATDDDGRASFPTIASGSYRILVDDSPTHRSCQQRVDVADAGKSSVEIVLPDAQARLALSGRVLDEDGAPLSEIQVRVIAGLGQDEWVYSEPDGTFEAWTLPVEELIVEVAPIMDNDIFEPGRARVPFGTTDFVVRRAHLVDHWRLEITVIDRNTRLPVRSTRLFAAAIQPSDCFVRWSMEDGLARVTITDRPNACLLFAARGYKPLIRPCRELLPPVQPSGYITIELEPGFECRLTVVDGATSDPLANVEFKQPSGAVLRTDAQGLVVLAAREWPPPYRVECEGYQPIEWDPRDWPAWKSVLALDRVVR